MPQVTDEPENWITKQEFQVNQPNGDIDFVSVYDLPKHLAQKFLEKTYNGLKVEHIEEIINPKIHIHNGNT